VRVPEGLFLAAAALLHVSIPVAAEVAPTPMFVAFFLAKSSSRTLEIDVDVNTAELPYYQDPAIQALPMNDPRRIARNDRRAYDRRFAYVPNPNDPPPSEDFSEAPAELVSPDSTADDYGRPPTREEMDGLAGVPGFGGRQAWQYPGGVPPDDARSPGAPTKTPRRTFDPDRGTKILDSGVRAKDSRLGLDFPGGSVIKSAIADSVRASDAPYVSSGSFAVSVNPQGRVTKVTLVSFSGGESSVWQAIAKSAQARLAGRTLPMKSSFAKGAMVAVQVRSDQKRPGGGTSRDGATFSFDVTDIDSRPVRVVTSSASATPVK
jgi:hypothetical protein